MIEKNFEHAFFRFRPHKSTRPSHTLLYCAIRISPSFNHSCVPILFSFLRAELRAFIMMNHADMIFNFVCVSRCDTCGNFVFFFSFFASSILLPFFYSFFSFLSKTSLLPLSPLLHPPPFFQLSLQKFRSLSNFCTLFKFCL